MNVGWVSCASWVFKDSLRNTLPIESGELSQAYFRDFEGCGRASLKMVTQASECEEILINVGDIWGDYKISEDVWVSSHCQLDDGK